MIYEEMLELFNKIPVTFPKPVDHINNIQTLLTNKGGKWFMDKHK